MANHISRDIRPADVLALEAEIRYERDCGAIHIHIGLAAESRGRSSKMLADELISHIGLTPLGKDWRGIGRQEAGELITRFLGNGLVFNDPLMPTERAEKLSASVMALAEPNAAFLTNVCESDEYNRPGWISLTNSTFDQGVVFLGKHNSGIVWVEEED